MLQHPDAIRHFQSLCDACQELSNRFHGPSELRLYADGYLTPCGAPPCLIRSPSAA